MKPHFNDSASHINNAKEDDCFSSHQPLPRREKSQESAGFSQIYAGFDFDLSKEAPRAPGQQSSGDEHVSGWLSPTPSSEAGSNSDGGSPRPRPRPAGYGSTEYFLKKGNWKRRGIVFLQQEQTQNSDDDCFEIP